MKDLKQNPQCGKCGIKLTDENWYLSSKKNHSYICKQCHYINKKKYLKEYQQKLEEVDQIHICRKCGIRLTNENWYSYDRKQRKYICKDCSHKEAKERYKKWCEKNKDKINQWKKEYQKKYQKKLKNEAIEAYGSKCACCGEDRKEYLTIDHIFGNGGKQRREIGLSGYKFYLWLKKNNYPDGFQILCFNCNCAKRNYSICPQSEEFQVLFEEKLKQSYNAKYYWNLRLNIIKGYGGKCQLCGETNPHFLTIDHIFSDGAEERRIRKENFYVKLRNNNYPKDNYRLLCYNCNCALGFNRITEEEISEQNKNKVKDKERKNDI